MKGPGKTAVWAISAGCGMLAGMWLGGGSVSDDPEGVSPNGRRISERRKALASNKVEAGGFKSMLARLERSGGLPESAVKAMESADKHTLREWMLSLAGEPIDARNFGANRKRYRMLAALSAELFRREGAESVRWAEGVGKELLQLCILSELARVDLPAAKSWIPGYLKKHQTPTNPIFDAALEGAVMRGADETLKMEQAESTGYIAYRFPPDFEFATYIANTTSLRGMEDGVRYWSAKDPDEVEKALREGLRGKTGEVNRIFSQAYQGRAAMVGETEAARWIWPVLRALPPGEKAEVYPWMLWGETELNRAIWEEASDDAERAELLSLSPGPRDDGEAAKWLNQLGSEELKADTIARWIEKLRAQPSPSRRELLERIIGEANLSKSRRDQFRAKLVEP